MEQDVREKAESGDSKKSVKYPAAPILADACFQDYLRLQENYNRLYEKVNIALAFAGVALTLVVSTLDFTHLFSEIAGYRLWMLILRIVYTICEVACVASLFYATVRLLLLLRSKALPVFKSEDVRDKEVNEATEDEAAMWLIDKYTICTHGMRPIVAKKQLVFENALTAIIIGLILFAIVVGIGKAGVL